MRTEVRITNQTEIFTSLINRKFKIKNRKLKWASLQD